MSVQADTIDFYRYPPIGREDWEYAFAAARVRTLEPLMLRRATLEEAANAPDFAAAAELLGGTEYAVGPSADGARIESVLLERRTETRRLYKELIHDEVLRQMIELREDLVNMRLAIRRNVVERPIGRDYSDDGTVPAEEFEEVFEQENFDRFPDHIREALEAAVLGYYENKDVRRIDYEIDRFEMDWRVRCAQRLNSPFCLSYSRLLVDLTNIRTMLRLRLAERDERQFFFDGGFVTIDTFVQGFHHGFDAIPGLFAPTPYYDLVDHGVRYLKAQQSFLVLERGCEDYLMEFLKTTRTLTAGYQPVMAYVLMKEAEIRTVRMILIGKKNGLSSQLLRDRLGTWMG